MKKLSEQELLDWLFAHPQQILKASLLLAYGGSATHFLKAGKQYLWDEGIEGATTRWRSSEFAQHYRDTKWLLSYPLH